MPCLIWGTGYNRKRMFKVFIAETILRNIILAESQRSNNSRSNLFKVLKMARSLYVAIDSLDLAWIKQLKDDYGLVADTTRTDYIKSISTKPELVLKNPSSLFILDIPIAEAKKIQVEYGVICRSGVDTNVSILIDVNDEHTTDKNKPLGRGWDTVLDSVESLPSNALILTDRYLFKTTNARYGNGFDNVRSILTELLPRELNTTFNITVVFDKDSIDPLYDFQTIAKRLNDIKDEFKRPYPIIMEVLGITGKNNAYYNLHNRRIISNYFVVKMDYSLAAFNKAVGTADQTITPQVLFTEDSLNRHSSAPLKTMEQIVSTLREFSNSLLLPYTKHNSYYYAVNGQWMEKCISIRNRLIND